MPFAPPYLVQEFEIPIVLIPAVVNQKFLCQYQVSTTERMDWYHRWNRCFSNTNGNHIPAQSVVVLFAGYGR